MQLFKFKRRQAYEFVLLLFFLLIFLLRTYAPDRDYVYSSLGGVLILVLSFLYILREMLLRSMLNKKALQGVFFMCALFLFFSVSTLLNIDGVSNAARAGLIGNLLIQFSILLVSLFWVSSKFFDFLAVTKFLAICAAVFSFFSAVVALELYFTNQALWGPLKITVSSLRWPQLYGWYASPNYIIDYLAAGMLSLIYLHLITSAKKVTFIFLMFLVMCVFLTGSLGGIVGLFLAMAFSYLILFSLNNNNAKVLFFIKTVFVGILVIFFIIGLMLAYFSYAGLDLDWLSNNVLRIRPDRIATGTGRTEIWLNALSIFSNSSVFNILFGLGNNQYVELHGASMHNTHFQIIVDHGLVTYSVFIFFIFMFIFLTFRALRKYKNNKELSFSIVYLVTIAAYAFIRGLFQSSVFLSGNLVWLITVFAFLAFLVLLSSKRFANVS